MKAVIFDMNGVIIDDEHIHQKSWKIFAAQHNFKISEQDFIQKVFGRTEKDTFTFLFKKQLSEKQVGAYSDDRLAIVTTIMPQDIQIADGLLLFLDNLKNNNISLGVATSSRKKYMNFIMDHFNIRNYFTVILTAEDIKQGKPDPEIYLKTADKLGVLPSECVVFEDSISGIKSAKSAGMKVVGISTTCKREELKLADIVIDSFKQVSYSTITAM